MSDGARERILARIRAAQGRAGARPTHEEVEAVEETIRRRARGPLPFVEADLVARFRARAESLQSTTDLVPALADVPAAVARYLARFDLPSRGCVSPQVADLGWSDAGLALEVRGAVDADPIGVTGVFAALAETGTIMVVSGPDTPATTSLLPETHIAIVPASRIVPYMEEAFALARAELGELPRLVNFISGPSRTGDIDQTIVLGAHGPYRVHLIIVADG